MFRSLTPEIIKKPCRHRFSLNGKNYHGCGYKDRWSLLFRLEARHRQWAKCRRTSWRYNHQPDEFPGRDGGSSNHKLHQSRGCESRRAAPVPDSFQDSRRNREYPVLPLNRSGFNQKNSSMLCIGVKKIKIYFDTSQLCCGVVHFAHVAHASSGADVSFSTETCESPFSSKDARALSC